ncbi:MAG: DinB family protein [Nocardioides sp.]
MATFDESDDLRGARFVDVDLRGARFVGSDLSGVVMRGVQVDDADIDAPWLLSGGASLLVNGVDVAPYVAGELDRRFPGRDQQRAGDPDGLRSAWAALQDAWAAALDRVATMPEGTVDESVDGEWSFAQTLRHLVHATDMWLGRGILGIDQPFHPLGLLDVATAGDGTETFTSAATEPSYDEVLVARADRVAMVRDFLAGVTPEELAGERRNPHDPAERETTLSCLHVILEEEWEHLRYAVRDLDALG